VKTATVARRRGIDRTNVSMVGKPRLPGFVPGVSPLLALTLGMFVVLGEVRADPHPGQSVDVVFIGGTTLDTNVPCMWYGSDANVMGQTAGGCLPVTGLAGELGDFTFVAMAPASVNAASLALYDTAVLNVASQAMACNTNTLTSQQQDDLVGFVAAGHKLIIYDSECPPVDYSWLPYPFTTANPGALGQVGTLSVIEDNLLSTEIASPDCVVPPPLDPTHCIDVVYLGGSTDAVGDMNVMITRDPNWCLDMSGTNAIDITGPVHTYAKYPSGTDTGLIIYNGLDQNHQSFEQPNLRKIWVQELQHPFNPSGLPCGRTVVGITLAPQFDTNDVGDNHTVTATLTDPLGNPQSGILVTFTILSGPNAGAGGTCSPNADCTSDASGQVSFTYTGSAGPGIDEIEACFVDDQQVVQCSQIAEKEWIQPIPPEACCFPDGWCIDLFPDDCLAQGGIPQGESTVCTESEACCFQDDTCAMVDPLCCDDLGGVPLGAGSVCLGMEACCLPDDTCVMADALCCVNELGGTPQGAGTVCTQPEACCFPDDTCQMLDPLCCVDQGGVPQGAGSVCLGQEACCDADGVCYMADAMCCLANGDSPQGAGTVCTVPEACCFPDDTCKMLDPLCCIEQGGTPEGPGSACGTPAYEWTTSELSWSPDAVSPIFGWIFRYGTEWFQFTFSDIDTSLIDDDVTVEFCFSVTNQASGERGLDGLIEVVINPGEAQTTTYPYVLLDNVDPSNVVRAYSDSAGSWTTNGEVKVPKSYIIDGQLIVRVNRHPDHGVVVDPHVGTEQPIDMSTLPPTVPPDVYKGDDAFTVHIGVSTVPDGGTVVNCETGGYCVAVVSDVGVEACCLPDGTCEMADALCCVNELGGTPQGPGAVCTAPEACCFPDGTCDMLDPLCCVDQGGTPQGPGTVCTADEACCLGDGSCIMADPLCCTNMGGTVYPDGVCGGMEGCCIPDPDVCLSACVTVDTLCCVEEFGGTPMGPGTACGDDSDGDGVDDLCDICRGVDDAMFCPGCKTAIPTVSDWGLVALTLLLLTAGKIYFGRRQVATG